MASPSPVGSGSIGNGRSELRWRPGGYAKDEGLAGDVALADVEVFAGDAAGDDVVRCPVDAAAVDADAEVGLDVVRGDAPVLGVSLTDLID